jgi:tRNA/rRNA methyltransferase
MKNKIGFILVNPQLGENIGSCARALKNFGFSKLSLVKPRDGWPNTKARMTSVGAYDLIKKAKVYKNTLDSVKEYNLIFSTTARKRDINKKHISISSFIELIKKKKKSKIGIMFGPEASGLSNEDLSYSNYIIQIPTSKKFNSINLSHSLTIICYEIFKLLNTKRFKKDMKFLKISSKKHTANLLQHLENLLEKIGFFKPQEKKEAMLLNINNLFYRLELSDKEIRILGSIISTLSKRKRKHN